MAERSQVRGPTSALSSFLRERGIRAPTGRRQQQQQQQQQQTTTASTASFSAEATPAAASTPVTVVAAPVTAASETATAAATAPQPTAAAVAALETVAVGASGRTRKRGGAAAAAAAAAAASKKKHDSDDSDGDAGLGVGRSGHSKRARRAAADGSNRPSDPMLSVHFCSRCQRRYVPAMVLDLLSRSSSSSGGGSGGSRSDASAGKDAGLCGACLGISGHASAASRSMSKISKKKREMQVLAVSGEMQGIILSLRDMCIKLIADRIEDVEQFGDIPYASKRKISKIISRQRQLNNRTVQLFLGADEEMVELFDCTLLDEDGLISVAMLCPNVRVLTLGLCGRATDAVLEHIGSHCPAIEALTLRGPFLPTNHGFSAMFSGLGPSLRELVLEHAAKLSEPALRVLREAAPALRVLSLTACTAVGDDAMEHIAALAELESLELNGLGSGVSVASLLDLVDKLGPQLTTLSLNGYELLDDTVVDRIATVCQTLTVLSLSECPKVTPEGLTSSLTRLTTRHPDGMHTLLLNRNVQLTDAVLATAVNQFSPTLARLGINGLDELSEAAMQAVAASCTALVEVDLSWIRSLADGALETLLTRAHSLERVRVFGCHELSQAVLNRTWRNADGRVIEIQGNEFD